MSQCPDQTSGAAPACVPGGIAGSPQISPTSAGHRLCEPLSRASSGGGSDQGAPLEVSAALSTSLEGPTGEDLIHSVFAP